MGRLYAQASMTPSAHRVAQLFAHSSRVAAGSAEDITRNLPFFESAKDDFEAALEWGREAGWEGDHIGVRRKANIPWVQLIAKGFRIVEGILSTRSIPRRKAKGMEMAYRLCSTSRQMPKDVYKWWAKNKKRVDLIIEAANTWPEKQEGTDELFALGSFRVHNTLGAEGRELASLKTAIERVERLAKKNPVPGFARAIYGDIYVVARLSQAHNAAWYRPTDDSLYLRRTTATGLDEVQAMLHELGHRYWAKFASNSAKREWANHHHRIGRVTSGDIVMPDVGDPLPVKIRGTDESPVVQSRERGAYFYARPNQGGMGSISTQKVFNYISQKASMEKFPTLYSATNEQEHFCEALALLALDTLGDEHAIPFKSIWT